MGDGLMAKQVDVLVSVCAPDETSTWWLVTGCTHVGWYFHVSPDDECFLAGPGWEAGDFVEMVMPHDRHQIR